MYHWILQKVTSKDRAQPRWQKICDDLKLPQKWKKITGKEINFTHRSVPPMHVQGYSFAET